MFSVASKAANFRTFDPYFCFNTLDNRSSTTEATLPLCNSFVLVLSKKRRAQQQTLPSKGAARRLL